MNLFNIGRAFQGDRRQQSQADGLRAEADQFQLAGDGGYWTLLKGALFILLGYYNARLFVVTVAGWEGYLTAAFALAGEATALYCINNVTRSAGWHRIGLGVFGALLTLFSITHATISFFRMEQHASTSSKVHFYCERVAFPLLFGLLVLAVVIVPLLHWRKKIAAEQAKAQVQIASSRARLIGESAALRNESELERERLGQLTEKIGIEREYIGQLRNYVTLKEEERALIDSIADPELRAKIAEAMHVSLPPGPPSSSQRRIAPLSPARPASWPAPGPTTQQSANAPNGGQSSNP